MTAISGTSASCGRLADLLHGFVAVHVGHHDVDQSDVNAGRLLENDDAVLAALGVEDLGVIALEDAGQRIDVADVVIDDEDLGAIQFGDVMRRRGRAFIAGRSRRRLRGFCLATWFIEVGEDLGQRLVVGRLLGDLEGAHAHDRGDAIDAGNDVDRHMAGFADRASAGRAGRSRRCR